MSRVGSDVALSCVELCSSVGYAEGTQQIQQLIVARRVLGLSSTELQ
jgi:acyl-CoA dehydrogenase